jgi:hypothetical protein
MNILVFKMLNPKCFVCMVLWFSYGLRNLVSSGAVLGDGRTEAGIKGS